MISHDSSPTPRVARALYRNYTSYKEVSPRTFSLREGTSVTTFLEVPICCCGQEGGEADPCPAGNEVTATQTCDLCFAFGSHNEATALPYNRPP